MKVLVFAHTPPPHHGQSYMVQLLLEGLGGDYRKPQVGRGQVNSSGIECYHINVRLSSGLHDIGSFSFRKILWLVGYCLQAVWCRFRYDVRNFYYIPAPGKRTALYRDWLVMALCRPFFKRLILHWHAAGLAQWLEMSNARPARCITRTLMGHPDLSIVLSEYNKGDGEWLGSRRVKVVYNGIPDPCPAFETDVLPRRQARLAARRKLKSGEILTREEVEQSGGDPWLIKLLFLAHCSREKGLFDAVEAVALANSQLVSSGSPLRFQLTVAGEFVDARERRAFEERIGQTDLQLEFVKQQGMRTPCGASEGTGSLSSIRYVGFLSAEAKHRALVENDCLCFPTYYHAESFGLVVIEAMAFGLPIVATRWRAIPELFPADYPGLVEVRSPQGIVEGVFRLILKERAGELRNLFAQKFNMPQHFTNLTEALHSMERAAGGSKGS